MDSVFEARLVEHCAPTLAGLKLASLFCLPPDKGEAAAWVRRCDRALAHKGLRLRLMRSSGCGQLVYVYRERLLRRTLEETAVARFLSGYGYMAQDMQGCLQRLALRLMEQEFPHEIGLFLGYPPEDVEGFIENRGKNCKCVGCWKVYGDPEQAVRQFARFKKCREVYLRLYRDGKKSLDQLTVAS